MACKKILGILILLLFLLSCASAVTVTEVTTNDIASQQNQSFAQLNARILDMTNQVTALKTQLESFQNNAFMKSDVQNLYENMVVIGKQSNLDVLTSIIVVVILAFCIFFILIGKNLLPVHTKEWRETKERENKALLNENQELKKRLEKLQINTPRKSFLEGWRKKTDSLNAPIIQTTPCPHPVPTIKDYPKETIINILKEATKNETMDKKQD